MKNKFLLTLPITMFLSLISCSEAVKVPNEISFTIDELTTNDFHTELQKGLIDSDDPDGYIDDHWLEVGSFSNSTPKALSFSWKVETDNNAKASKYVVSLSESESFDNVLTYSSTKETVDIYNLKINTSYYWKVSAYYGSKSFDSDVSSFKTVSNGPRNIYVDGVENVRDLGGYVTESGKEFKQGLVYRTAQFNYNRSDEDAIKSAPTAKGKQTLLKELKLKSEIDVRQRKTSKGKDETVGIKSSPLGSSVKYQYMPMSFGGSNIFEEESNFESIKQFFDYCSHEENYPVAFHCVRGTDRTGALAYALGSLCGVSEELLLKDYLFSNFANINGTIRERDIDGTSFYVRGIRDAEGSTRSEKTMNYLNSTVGVSKTTLEAIKNILLK